MSSIIISGRPNSESTSECILLAEVLKKNYPTINCIKVLKHPDEWSKYSGEICNLFGFQKATHPLIYFSNGDFIGDREKFINYVSKEFNLKYELNDKIIFELTQENINKVNKEYNERLKGKTLRDKIDTLRDKVKFPNDYNALNRDYEVTYISGMKIFYKYDQKFSPKESIWETYLESKDVNSFEVDLTTNKIIEDSAHNISNHNQSVNISKNIKDSKFPDSRMENSVEIDNSKDYREDGKKQSLKEKISLATPKNNESNNDISPETKKRAFDKKGTEKENNMPKVDRKLKDSLNSSNPPLANIEVVNAEEDENSDSIVVKKRRYEYYVYKKFNIPQVEIPEFQQFVVENNVI